MHHIPNNAKNYLFFTALREEKLSGNFNPKTEKKKINNFKT
jgi:hypothetical protein